MRSISQKWGRYTHARRIGRRASSCIEKLKTTHRFLHRKREPVTSLAQGAGSATYSSSLVSSTKQKRNISSASLRILTTPKRRQSFSTFASRKLSVKHDE